MGDLSDYIWLFVGVFWILLQLMRRARSGSQEKPAPPPRQAPKPEASRQYSGPRIERPRQISGDGKAPPPIVPR